jgi:sugar transferase (PEP-CTERM/EpsH1 system associated)
MDAATSSRQPAKTGQLAMKTNTDPTTPGNLGTNEDLNAQLVCHVIYRLDFGGLENGLVNLINHMPRNRFRHAVICLTYASDFRDRIRRDDVDIYELHKREGKDIGVYRRLWHLLRDIRPDIVHTRNISTIDMLAVARLAGIRRLVHSEHGRDFIEMSGDHRKYNLLRRLSRLFAGRYITVSRELAAWLSDTTGVSPERITAIHNGVDTERFKPAARPPGFLPDGFANDDAIVIGTIGRMAPIKDQMNLAQAFVRLLTTAPEFADRVRLVLVGDGETRTDIEAFLEASNARALCWLPGYRDDADSLYQLLDIFALPSRREGISNTILEAMASGLPVVATRVGGNPEIVADGVNGTLVPPEDPQALADALLAYLQDPTLLRRHGQAGRERALRDFSMAAMVEGYGRVYDAT